MTLTDLGNTSLRTRYKAFRKTLLGYMPFVKRRRHERALERMEAFWVQRLEAERRTNLGLGFVFLSRPPLASAAKVVIRTPLRELAGSEACLFVTHASEPELKIHVMDHVNTLIDAGIAVILIVNTDLAPELLSIPPDFERRLHGCLVRENVGYDFAAWSHAYTLASHVLRPRRLYLINDSVWGPLNPDHYRAMLHKIRSSEADLIGLTSNPYPFDHLQSYFLVMNERLLGSPVFDGFMRSVVSMPTKESVIDCYEMWLTRYLEDRGFSSAAMFAKLSPLPTVKPDDTLYFWKELLDVGFPFIKASAVAKMTQDEAQRFVPSRYLARKPAGEIRTR
jgi:hypothetical protein